MSPAERNKRIEELTTLIQQKEESYLSTKKMADQYNAMQLSLKIVINAEYGATANKHYVCFCNGVASTITAHGRDLIQHMDVANEDYWYNHFHLDYEFHKQVVVFSLVLKEIRKQNLDKHEILNDKEKYDKLVETLDLSNLTIPKISKIDDSYINSDTKEIVENPTYDEINVLGTVRRKEPVSVYMDTDSLFVSYEPAFRMLGIKNNHLDYVLFMSNNKMKPFFKTRLDEYANKYDVKNIQDFEMEQVSKSIIFLEKKMYLKNVIWDEGVYSEPETNLLPKGFDLVRSSTPLFVRENVNGILDYFFKNPNNYNFKEVIKMLRKLKDLFKLAKEEDISMSTSCSNYDAKVIDDQDELKFQTGTHHAVKSAALHNYLLNKNPEYKKKYNLIKSGQKIKYYYTTNPDGDKFAYIAGQYPKEIAIQHAPIDYETQFQKCILNMVNRFGEVLGIEKIKISFRYTEGLF